MTIRLILCVFTGICLLAVPAFAEPVSDTNTDAEAKEFWPMYNDYQKDLEGINKQLVQTIKEYADAFNKGTISNDTAKKLLNEALTVEEQEVKLKRASAEKLGKVLPATKVARYIQLETKIRSVIKFEMAQEIPLVN